MYLRKLIGIPIENRPAAFLQVIERYKDALKNEKNLEKFILIYPEWALEFQYVDKLKLAILGTKDDIPKIDN